MGDYVTRMREVERSNQSARHGTVPEQHARGDHVTGGCCAQCAAVKLQMNDKVLVDNIKCLFK